MAASRSTFTEFGPTTLETGAGISFDADTTLSPHACAARFEDSGLSAYVDEHKFVGLHPLGRRAFTMSAFGHLGRERYDLDDGRDEWSAGAANGSDLSEYEAWQTALGAAAEGLPHEWLDPITLGVMRHPCRAADGFVYERAAIREWLQRQRSPSSPLTGAPLQSRALRPDAALQGHIRAELTRRGVRNL